MELANLLPVAFIKEPRNVDFIFGIIIKTKKGN